MATVLRVLSYGRLKVQNLDAFLSERKKPTEHLLVSLSCQLYLTIKYIVFSSVIDFWRETSDSNGHGGEPPTRGLANHCLTKLGLISHILVETFVMLTRFANPPQRVVISGAQQSTPAWYWWVDLNHRRLAYQTRLLNR